MANKKGKLELAIQQLNNAQRNLFQADLPIQLQLKCSRIIDSMINDIVDAEVEMMNEKKTDYKSTCAYFMGSHEIDAEGVAYSAEPDDNVTLCLVEKAKKGGNTLIYGIDVVSHPEVAGPALMFYVNERYVHNQEVWEIDCKFVSINELLNDFIKQSEEEEENKIRDQKALYYELAIEFLEGIREAAIEDKEYDSADIIELTINELKDIKNKEVN